VVVVLNGYRKVFKLSHKRKVALNNLTLTSKGKTSYKRAVSNYTIKKAMKNSLKAK